MQLELPILRRYIPDEILDRPKMGFTVPVERWLRGGLEGRASSRLVQTRLKRRGLYDGDAVGRLWKRFQGRANEFGVPVWTLAILDDWCEHWNVSFE